MDKNGHVSIHGEALGGFRVQIKVLWYPPTCSTWALDLEGTRGIDKFQTSTRTNIPSSFSKNPHVWKMQGPNWSHSQYLSIQTPQFPFVTENLPSPKCHLLDDFHPGPQPSEAPGFGPFYYDEGLLQYTSTKSPFFTKRAQLLKNKNKNLPRTQQGRTRNFDQMFFFKKGPDPTFR